MAALGIRRPWTTHEDDIIRAHWGRLTQLEIGAMIGRNFADVSRRGREIGLQPRYRRWTPEDDAVLRKLYRTTPILVLAKRLGFTPAAVAARARLLGVQVHGGRGRQRV